MKIVIVSEEGMANLGLALAIIAAQGSSEDVEVVNVSHTEMFATIEEYGPQIVIVDNYDEGACSKNSVLAYHVLKEFLRPEQRLVRVGRSEYSHTDYIKHPNGSSMEAKDRLHKTIKSLIAA